jgi:hypothetical protein
MLLLFFASCAKKMDESLIPSYIQIEEIQILTNQEQGSSSSNVYDAWVYINGEEMGAFPLPAKVPYLGSGQVTLRVAPGIKLNGVSATRVPYPLAEPSVSEVELYKDSILIQNVNCRYFATTKFELIENFEGINISFETSSINSAVWRQTDLSTDPAEFIFEGNHSGGAFMNSADDSLLIVTKQSFSNLPKGGEPIFIELDFNTNTTVALQISGLNNNSSTRKNYIYLNNTNSEWTKIYINLTNTISSDLTGNNYRFWFAANHTNSETQSYFLIDNFKILYRDIQTN